MSAALLTSDTSRWLLLLGLAAAAYLACGVLSLTGRIRGKAALLHGSRRPVTAPPRPRVRREVAS